MTVDLTLPPPHGRTRVALRALRHRNFRLLWLGQLARGTGMWMQLVALPLLVVALGGGAWELGTLAALQFAPILVLAPLGGVLADQLPKRRLLVGLQVVSAAQATALALLVVAGKADIGLVLLLSAVFGLVNAAEMPVRWSLVSELVGPTDLPNAIALHSAAFNATRILGPAIAGLLIALIGAWAAFVWAAAVAILTAFLVLRLDPERIAVATGGMPDRIGGALTEGLRYAVASGPVRTSLLTLTVVSTIGMSFQAILPIFAVERLGMDARGYGALLAAMGVGALVAVVPMSTSSVSRARRYMLITPLILAVSVAVLTIVRSQLVALLPMATIGFAYVLAAASINLTIQHTASAEIRGRMVGLYIATLHGGAAIGGFAIGALAEGIGPLSAMVVSAAATALGALILALTGRPYPRLTEDSHERNL